jgi:hypothetical protein
MKNIILVIAALVVTTGLACAQRPIPWPEAKPPRLSMPDAYPCAIAALGTATNQFYCTSASCYSYSDTSQYGWWKFEFCNTNDYHKRVLVSFNKKVRVEEGPEVYE